MANVRQRAILKRAMDRCADAAVQLRSHQGLELACLSIAEALDALNETTGCGCTEDVLDNIFERFCVGK
jgi:tRNA U34 5-carboxymethylaminomethyl modifying GTPase MnmE/TrmE